MSLLTGDARSAKVHSASGAVLYEVEESLLEPILSGPLEVAMKLANIVAGLQLPNRDSLDRDSAASQPAAHQSFSEQLLDKTRKFFFASEAV